MKKRPIAERFWEKVNKAGATVRPDLGPCWIWKGSIHPRGYGRVSVGGRPDWTHRVAWRLEHGEIPDGMLVCHKCDNHACVRPDHLFLGTHIDNIADRHAKGRTWRQLTEEQVARVKQLAARGARRCDIAREVGCSERYVGMLVRGEWRRDVA